MSQDDFSLSFGDIDRISKKVDAVLDIIMQELNDRSFTSQEAMSLVLSFGNAVIICADKNDDIQMTKREIAQAFGKWFSMAFEPGGQEQLLVDPKEQLIKGLEKKLASLKDMLSGDNSDAAEVRPTLPHSKRFNLDDLWKNKDN